MTGNPDAPLPAEPSVGSRLREARRATGLKQREVAEAIGVTRRAVYEWEADQRLPQSALPALAQLYGTSVSQLLYGVEPASVELSTMRHEIAHLRLAVSEIDQRLMTVLGLVEQVAELVATALEQAAERRRQP